MRPQHGFEMIRRLAARIERDAQGARHGAACPFAVPDLGQICEEELAIGSLAARQLTGEGGLSDPARAEERHDLRPQAELRAQPREVLLAPVDARPGSPSNHRDLGRTSRALRRLHVRRVALRARAPSKSF
jgi:hypothetical protein